MTQTTYPSSRKCTALVNPSRVSNNPGVVTREAEPQARGRSTAAVLGVLVVSLLFVACGSTGAAAPGQTSSGAAVSGADVYAASCASCHGADLRGTDKGPSHLSIVYEPNHHGDASFRAAITNGVSQHHWNFGDMEPVEGLSENEIEAVIAFVRTEQERLGFE